MFILAFEPRIVVVLFIPIVTERKYRMTFATSVAQSSVWTRTSLVLSLAANHNHNHNHQRNNRKKNQPLRKRPLQDALIIERDLQQRGFRYIIGSDDSGRGCIAGPLVTASCCILLEDCGQTSSSILTPLLLDEVDDSKRLTKETRQRIYQEILEKPESFLWNVATRSNQEIDDMTLEQTTMDCFQESIEGVIDQLYEREGQQFVTSSSVASQYEKSNDLIYSIVDGHKSPARLPIPSRAWKGGDEVVYSVALASIIARCHHETLMMDLAAEYPNYKFDLNGGYASKQHTEALHQYGPSPIHRQSCKPVRDRGQPTQKSNSPNNSIFELRGGYASHRRYRRNGIVYDFLLPLLLFALLPDINAFLLAKPFSSRQCFPYQKTWNRLAARRALQLDDYDAEFINDNTVGNQDRNDFDDYQRDGEFQKRSNRWILLVDDEESIRTAVGQLLFDRGFQVTACADAPTALKIAKERRKDDAGNPRYPDCIVSDVRMPEMDGLQLLEVLRGDSRLQAIPVVLLTAKGLTQDRIAGYNAGADAYLPKPFDPDELVSICDSVIQQYEILNGHDIKVDDLKQDLDEIKFLLLEKGGGGVGNGWVEKESNVFLAPDERQVLELLCQGLMNKEIAAKTFLSTRRVEQLLTSMYRKVNVKNRTELVRWAVSSGNVQI